MIVLSQTTPAEWAEITKERLLGFGCSTGFASFESDKIRDCVFANPLSLGRIVWTRPGESVPDAWRHQ